MTIIPYSLVALSICGLLVSLFRWRIRAVESQMAERLQARPPVEEKQSEYEWTGCIMTKSGKTYPIIEKKQQPNP